MSFASNFGFQILRFYKRHNVLSVAVVYALFFLLAMASCSPEAEKASEPPGLAPKLSVKQLLPVLADVHIAENLVRDKRLERDSTVTVYDIAYYYEQICAMHQVDIKDLKYAIEYYTARPKQLEKLYEEVEKYMKKMEVEYKDVKPTVAKKTKAKPPLARPSSRFGKKPPPSGK